MADSPSEATEKNQFNLNFWVIIAVIIAIIFFFGPTIMKMFNNNSSNSFGEQELSRQSVTELLSNLN